MAEENDFERLLGVMPKIAEAVKALPVDLQKSAYEDLIRTFKGEPVPLIQPSSSILDTSSPDAQAAMDPAEEEDADVEHRRPRASRKPAKAAASTRKSAARKSWVADRNIDFWPDGKKSFQEFVDEKRPTSVHQKNLLAVYWLEEIAGRTKIGVGQILAAYKAVDWDEPTDPQLSLRRTASAEHWIDTTSTSDVKTTPGGRNMIKKMPSPTRGSK